MQEMVQNMPPSPATSVRAIGIFGAGKVGTALSRLLVSAGFEVHITGSSRQTALDLIIEVVAPGALVSTPEALIAASDLIILTVPFGKRAGLPWGNFNNKIVIDAMNYWPPIDGQLLDVDSDPRSTSEQNNDFNPNMRLVKSFNHLGYHDMEDDPLPRSNPLRRAIAVASDDTEAINAVMEVIDAIGFDPVAVGSLRCGICLQPGNPAFGREMTARELSELMRAAEQVTKPVTA